MKIKKTHIADQFAKEYKHMLYEAIEHYDYRYRRYEHDYAITIIYTSDETVDLSKFTGIVRKTDAVMHLRNNLCTIIYDCVTPESAIKASYNLLAKIEESHSLSALFVVCAFSKEHISYKEIVKHLFHMLKYAIDTNRNNMVVEEMHHH